MAEAPVVHTAQIPATSTPAAPATETPKEVAAPASASKEAQKVLTEQELEARLAKEQQRIAADRKAKAKLREFEAERKQAREIIERWQKVQKDPFEALKLLGYDYDKLTELKMAQGTPDAKFKTVEQQIAEIRAEHKREIAALRQEKQEEQARSAQETVDRWKQSVSSFVADHPEDYQLIPKFKSEDLVTETAEEYFKVHGKVLSNKEAADLVESYLEEQVMEAAKTKRVQSKLGMKEDVKKDTQKNSAVQPTITNHTVGHANVSGLSPATESERIQRALAALG